MNEDLYIVKTQIKYEGCKYYVVKLDELANKYVYIDDGNPVREYEDAWRKPSMKARKDRKKWVRVLPKHSLISPDAVAIVDKMSRDLVYEICNGKLMMCSFSIDATKEAIELISEFKDNPEV